MGSCGSSCASPSAEALVEAAPPVVPKVYVLIIGVRGLSKADWFPKSNRFLHCTLKSSAGDTVFTTKRAQNVVDPIWNEEAEVRENSDQLEFGVWEETDNGKGTNLGKATLRSAEFDPEGFNGELPLEAGGKRTGAFLKVKVRMESGTHPEDARREFAVIIENPKKTTMLGLDVDKLDGCTLYVVSVKPKGPVGNYNQGKDPSLMILPGTFIVKVNDAEGNSELLAKALKSTPKADLLVRPPHELRIAIGSHDSLGLDIPKVPIGSSILITKVQSGPVEKWNKEHPEQEIKAGDRIISINGQEGQAPLLLKMLTNAKKDGCQMTIVRPAI